MKTLPSLSITLSFFLLSTGLMAQPVPDSSPKDHEFQIGLAAATSQSIYLGGESQTKLFPAIDYQYKRFYFQAGDIGFNLIDEKKWEVDFGIGIDLIGDIDRGDSPLLTNLPELSLPLNAFLSAQYTSPIGLFKVKHNYEINNKHNGNSSSINYSAPIFKGKWLIMPQISYEHYSSEIVNYFFGVDPTDASATIPAYQAGSANAFNIGVLGLFQINEKWSFVSNVSNEFAGDEISDSPIVEADSRLSVFAGVLYKIF